MKRGLMTHAGLGLLCLSDGGGNNVCTAQGEWVACTVQKSIVFVGIVTTCSSMCCLHGLLTSGLHKFSVRFSTAYCETVAMGFLQPHSSCRYSEQ